MITVTEPQVWTLIAVFTTAFLGVLGVISQAFFRALNAQGLQMTAQFDGLRDHLNGVERALRTEIKITNTRIDALAEITDTRFAALTNEMNLRFAQVDQRFEQIDQRFEQVDRRFEQIDRRFDRIEKRVDELDADMRSFVRGSLRELSDGPATSPVQPLQSGI